MSVFGWKMCAPCTSREHGSLGARDFARHLLAIFDRRGALAPSFDYAVTTWTFGDDLAMVFLLGEVTVEYGHQRGPLARCSAVRGGDRSRED